MKQFAYLVSMVMVAWAAATVASTSSFAVNPDEVLKDSGLEHRARLLSAELRCVVCQNQTIDDSDAPLAKDLRRLVRERLVAGDSDQQVRDYVVARYGQFVLLKPPFTMQTALLWFFPFIFVVIGIFVAYRGLFSVRHPLEDQAEVPDKLSDEEERRLDQLLKTPKR